MQVLGLARRVARLHTATGKQTMQVLAVGWAHLGRLFLGVEEVVAHLSPVYLHIRTSVELSPLAGGRREGRRTEDGGREYRREGVQGYRREGV